MNEREAIIRAEAWYLQQYQALAHGHLSLDTDKRAFREDPFVCIDLVPEFQTQVVKVLLHLAGGDVVLLGEGRPCPRCVGSKKIEYSGLLKMCINWGAKMWDKRRSHSI